MNTPEERESILQHKPALNPELMLLSARAYGMANYLVAHQGLLVNGEEGSLYFYEPGITDTQTKG